PRARRAPRAGSARRNVRLAPRSDRPAPLRRRGRGALPPHPRERRRALLLSGSDRASSRGAASSESPVPTTALLLQRSFALLTEHDPRRAPQLSLSCQNAPAFVRRLDGRPRRSPAVRAAV